MTVLDTYRKAFRSLRPQKTKNGYAPHKPVLLLAVIDLYARGIITGTNFPFSVLLIDTFRSIWADLVDPSLPYQPRIIYPAWRMQNEKVKFWRAIALPGQDFQKNSSGDVRSFSHFLETLLHLEIDLQLALLLSEPASRSTLQREILDKYFPTQTEEFLADQAGLRYQRYFEFQLREPQAPYGLSWDEPRKKLRKIEKDEEKYIRDVKFVRNVLHVYNKTCCISGLNVRHPSVSLVDACHIVPHADTGDDSIFNGIALTPTLHRAFDGYLLSIRPNDYKVVISKKVLETHDSPYRISQFAGREIQRPRNKDHWPGKDKLSQHYETFLSKRA